MSPLCKVIGYANTFGEFSSALDGDEPLREKIRPGAFLLLHHPITANVAHCSEAVATTWDKSLRLWQDDYGLAFEFDLPCTPRGQGTRDLVAGGYCSMSFGLITIRAKYFRDADGGLCREITKCDLDHVSIVDAGAFPSSCCWVAGMPSDRMSPRIRNASIRWHFGVIDRDRKRGAARANARYLAAKAADPSRRRPDKPLILIHGMEPLAFARKHKMWF